MSAIKPAVPEEVQYICDLCGKEIKQDIYKTDVIEVTEHDVGGNGWNEWPVTRTYHCHRECFSTALRLMKENGGKQ